MLLIVQILFQGEPSRRASQVRLRRWCSLRSFSVCASALHARGGGSLRRGGCRLSLLSPPARPRAQRLGRSGTARTWRSAPCPVSCCPECALARARRGCTWRRAASWPACAPRSQRASHQRPANVRCCAAGREFPYTPGAAAVRRSRALTSARRLPARATRHAGCQLDNPTWRYLTSRLRFSCICRFPLGFQSHLEGRRKLRSRAQCEGFVLRTPPGACVHVRRAHAEALTEAQASARSRILDAALKQRGGRSLTSDARERRSDVGMN